MILDLDPNELDEIRLALHVYRRLIVERSPWVTRRVVTAAMESAEAKVLEADRHRRWDESRPPPKNPVTRASLDKALAALEPPDPDRWGQRLLLPAITGQLGACPFGPPDGESITTEQGTATFLPGDSPEDIVAKMAAVGLVRAPESDAAKSWAFKHERLAPPKIGGE